MRAKRWNERLRLVITFFNITSIGAFGLSVIAPILEFMKNRNGMVFNEKFAFWGKLEGMKEISYLDVIAWEAAGAALAMHVFSHILVGLTEPEE